jgi:hypothetical protein
VVSHDQRSLDKPLSAVILRQQQTENPMTDRHTRFTNRKDVCMKLQLTLALLASPCAARAQSDPMQMARLASANQTGVMEYCQGKGWADQAAVDAQKAGAASLPPASDTTGISAAEATGKSGSLLNNGTAMPLSSMAAQTNTTVQALCGKLADSAKMVAAQRSSMPQMPAGMPVMPSGMPGMPGGMPALPNGMTMPAMPGMPKTQ